MAETLPGGLRNGLVFNVDNRNGPVGTALRADAAANTTLGDIDFSIRMARNPGAATEHTDRVLALATGSGNTDVAHNHSLAVHARMPMPALTGLLTFIAMNTFVEVNDQDLRPLHNTITDQRVQPLLDDEIGRSARRGKMVQRSAGKGIALCGNSRLQVFA